MDSPSTDGPSSPLACRESSDAPLLLEPRAPLDADAAALEEGQAARGAQGASDGDNCRRAIFTGAATAAVLGVVLLAAALLAPASAPEKTSDVTEPGVIGLNVIMRPTTRAPTEEKVLPQAPLRGPPDFIIEPPPGFYPKSVEERVKAMEAAIPESAHAARRNPMLRTATTTVVSTEQPRLPPAAVQDEGELEKGRYSEAGEWLGEPAPLRPPPDFAIPPPPDSPMDMGRTPDMLPDAPSGNPGMPRIGRSEEKAAKEKNQDWTIHSIHMSNKTFSLGSKDSAPSWAVDMGLAPARAEAPARRIEDVEAVQMAVEAASGPTSKLAA